jgi:hypothetical protein
LFIRCRSVPGPLVIIYRKMICRLGPSDAGYGRLIYLAIGISAMLVVHR